MAQSTPQPMQQSVEIRIREQLDAGWAETFTGLTLTHPDEGGTLLAGTLPDQGALHGLLERIRDLNLVLVSVTCANASPPDSGAHPTAAQPANAAQPSSASGGEMNGIAWSAGGVAALLLALLFGATLVGCRPGGAARAALTEPLAEPLGAARAAHVAIHAGDGNLAIDRLAGGEPLLASGELEYLEKQGPPAFVRSGQGAEAELTLQAGAGPQPWIRFPWAHCNGATTWRVHLNPAVQLDLDAHSNGGNIDVNLTGMAVRRVAADTGGGNIAVALPAGASALQVDAKTGAGNVTIDVAGGLSGQSAIRAGSGAGNVEVHLPPGIAARIHATSGMGKTLVDPGFEKLDKSTWQSPGYDQAAVRLEITINSGAGNTVVTVE